MLFTNLSVLLILLILFCASHSLLDKGRKAEIIHILEDSDFKEELLEKNLSLVKSIHLHIYYNIGDDLQFPSLERLSTLDIYIDPSVTSLPTNFFTQLPALEQLSISPNQDQSDKLILENTDDAEFPTGQRFVLRNNMFVNLNSLTELVIGGIKLKKIENDAFRGLDNLRILDLSKNIITHFDTNVLQNCCKKLKELQLSGNHISHINFSKLTIGRNKRHVRSKIRFSRNSKERPNERKSLEFLEMLDLHHNHIKEINTRTFGKLLENLIGLNLAENHIDRIHAFSLEGLQSLKSLSLESNNLTVLHLNCFARLRSLEELDLSNNQINTIEEGTFSNLDSLKELNLMTNNLNEIKPGNFDGLSKLENLDLSKNKIKFLDEGSLRSFKRQPNGKQASLRSLNLKYNRIFTFLKGCFSKLYTLEELNLAQNDLVHFNPVEMGLGHGEGFNLKRLYLHDNPWSCGCHLLPLLSWLKGANLTIDPASEIPNDLPPGEQISFDDYQPSKNRAVCNQPHELININLVDSMYKIEESCDKETSTYKSTCSPDSTRFTFFYSILLTLVTIYRTFQMIFYGL